MVRALPVLGIVLVGLAVAQWRSATSLRRRVGWAPRFDIGLLLTVVLVALLPPPQHDFVGAAGFSIIFLLAAALLLRQTYVVVVESDRRRRDVANFVLIAVPTVVSLVASAIPGEAFGWITFLAPFLGAFCLLLLPYDIVQSIRKRRVRPQDFLTSALGFLLAVLQVNLLLVAAAPAT